MTSFHPQGRWSRTNALSSMVQPRTPVRVTLRAHVPPDTSVNVRALDILTQLHNQVNVQTRPFFVVKSVSVRAYTLHPIRLRPWSLDLYNDSSTPIELTHAAKFFIPRNLVSPVVCSYHWPEDQTNNCFTLVSAGDQFILNVDVGENLSGPEECILFINFNVEWWNETVSDPVRSFRAVNGLLVPIESPEEVDVAEGPQY